MKYLYGEMLFHFEHLADPTTTRYVYSTEDRAIILAQVEVDGRYYELNDDYIAELEAGVLAFGEDVKNVMESDHLPAWARTSFIHVSVTKNGETQVIKLSDIERTVITMLEMPPEKRGVGFGPEEVFGLIGVIRQLAGAEG